MKLNFNHRGVKLFFITFAVKGRTKVLSKLVDEKSRPELTGLGEAVKAALLAIHKVNEAVGISDFIIMPDHVHFLMVVDYERDKNVSPLFLSHRVMDAVEMAIGRGLVTGKTGVAPSSSIALAILNSPSAPPSFARFGATFGLTRRGRSGRPGTPIAS